MWKLIPRHERTAGAKCLKAKFAYALKKDGQGKIRFAKARFVAMGCFQTEGVDFEETFASVMSLKNFRTLIAYANLFPDATIGHWDVHAAYVNANMDPDMPAFCEQPAGHEDPDPAKAGWICKLLKALYGLKNAGNLWQKHLRGLLAEIGMRPLGSDPSIYRLDEGEGWLIVGTYVDDIIPVFNEAGKGLAKQVLDKLMETLTIKDMGELKWALNTEILRDRKAGVTKISQEAFTYEMLTRFGMLNCKGSQIPMDGDDSTS